jgi:hypothetical protein
MIRIIKGEPQHPYKGIRRTDEKEILLRFSVFTHLLQ